MYYKIVQYELIDFISKCSTIIIALANICYAIFIFYYNKKRDNDNTRKSNNIEWLKALVLNHNLVKFYDFIKCLHSIVNKYKKEGVDFVERSSINSEIESEIEAFRQDFIELLSAISPNLYSKTLNSLDTLYEQLSISAADESKDYSVEREFRDEFTLKINKCKVDIIKTLFQYDGS